MVFLLNGKVVDALAIIVHHSVQQSVGRTWVKKLREVDPLVYLQNPYTYPLLRR
jgi:translation elongation factor EF-4